MAKQSFHEDFNRKERQESSSDRSFGLVFAAVFVIIGLWPLIHGANLRLWSLALAIVFAGISVIRPVLLSLSNRLWTRLGMMMSKVVSPVVLALLYYCSVVPTGLILRLFGKDPLHLKYQPDEESYWIKRDPPGPSSDSLNNQF